MTDRRKPGKQKSAGVPEDYTLLVKNVLAENFKPALKHLEKKVKGSKPNFAVRGRLFPDEIMLSLSLQCSKPADTATTVHISVDYDPMASQPKAEDLLALCLDVAGGVFSQYLGMDGKDGAKLAEAFAFETLSGLGELTEVPFQWTKVEAQKRSLYVLIDKTHLDLEDMAEAWLDQHDPDRAERESIEEAEAEELLSARTGSQAGSTRRPKDEW